MFLTKILPTGNGPTLKDIGQEDPLELTHEVDPLESVTVFAK
jgi:hypothetical protein